jgi:hypothetical protein
MRRLAAAIVVVVVVGCGGGDDSAGDDAPPDAPGCTLDANPLVGTWAGVSTMELAADGSFTISDGKRGTWQARGDRLVFLYSGNLFLVSSGTSFAVQGDRLGLGVYHQTSGGTALEGSTWLGEEDMELRAGSSAFQHYTTTIQLAADGTAERTFVNMVAGMNLTSVRMGTWMPLGDAFRLDLATQEGTPDLIDYVRLSEVVTESANTYSRVCN